MIGIITARMDKYMGTFHGAIARLEKTEQVFILRKSGIEDSHDTHSSSLRNNVATGYIGWESLALEVRN